MKTYCVLILLFAIPLSAYASEETSPQKQWNCHIVDSMDIDNKGGQITTSSRETESPNFTAKLETYNGAEACTKWRRLQYDDHECSAINRLLIEPAESLGQAAFYSSNISRPSYTYYSTSAFIKFGYDEFTFISTKDNHTLVMTGSCTLEE